MRTTLKRGFARGAELDGNGKAMLPPAALTPMTRYGPPEPPGRSPLKLVAKGFAWLAGIVLMLAIALVGGIYLFFHESVAAIRAKSEDVTSAQQFADPPPPPGQAAIALVIGYDQRKGPEATTVSRSDTVMVLRTDPATKSVSMLSFPRDLIVDVMCPGAATYRGRINQAYSDCGSKGTLLTVKNLIGLPINYVIAVDFHGFKKIVNKLGGVWVDVDRRYFNDNSGLGPGYRYATINLQPGYQRLGGGSALNYVRYRHTDSDLFRVARQQQFVKAMKYQLAHSFSLTTALKIVGTITKSVEVGVGGGREITPSTVFSYARFAYELPPGHFFQAKIEGLTGYAELSTDSSNIEAAVQEWAHPDVEASKVATHVALGEKVKTTTPQPSETSITVLNGNGVAGSAGNVGYLLSQRAYKILEPPENATGNAPNFDYWHTEVHWSPSIPRSKAAAQAVAKLFAPADVKRMAPEIAPLANGAMLVVIVGKTFEGELAATPPSRTPTERKAPNVIANPHDSAGLLRSIAKKARFPLLVPNVIEATSSPDSTKPVYVYRIDDDGHRGVRLVFRSGAGWWGIQQTDWEDAPILKDRSFRRRIGGRTYDLYYNGPRLHMVVLRKGGATYWVVNSLSDGLSNETMVAIAKGLRPLKAAK